MPYITSTRVTLASQEALITLVESVFRDRDWVAKEKQELEHLQKHNRDFYDYFANVWSIRTPLYGNAQAK